MANSNGNATAESHEIIKSWQPATYTPSVIQMELLDKQIVPEPNIKDNERAIQWVGHVDWSYACNFQTPKDSLVAGQIQMVFEGLDTFATVQLNGQEILKCENMFLKHNIDVGKLLRNDEQPNRLEILFESVTKKGDELEQKFGVRQAIERSPQRMHIRKVQVCDLDCLFDSVLIETVSLGLGFWTASYDSRTISPNLP